MATTRRKLLVDPYGRSGPYGETLACVLGAFKSRVVARAVSEAAHGDRLERFLNDGGVAVAQVLERFRAKRKAHVATLVRTWPPEPKIATADRRTVAERRGRQLEKFLEDCGRSAASLVGGCGENRGWKLAKFIGSLFWPYYFVRVSGRKGRAPYLLTWMPPASLLSRPCFGFWSTLDDEGTTPFYLYPTVVGLFCERGGRADAELPNLAAEWLDVGYSGEGGTLSGRGNVNIGHVQPLWPLQRSSEYCEDVARLAVGQKRESTAFSDAFYLNASALYLDETSDDGRDHLAGRLILCAAGPTILPALARLLAPGSSIEELGSYFLDIWRHLGGTVVGRQLRRRYEVVLDQLLPRQAEIDQSFLAHTVKGPVVDAIRYIDAALDGHFVRDNLSRARRELEDLEENSRTLLALGELEAPRSEFLQGSPGLPVQELDLGGLVERIRLSVKEQSRGIVVREAVGILRVGVAVPDALALVLRDLTRNALQEIGAMHEGCLEEREATLGICAIERGGAVVVEVRNTARPAAAKAAERLNSQSPEPVAARGLSRKGPSHYGIGSQQAKWIVERLGGRVSYAYENGEFVAAVTLRK